MVLAIAWPEPVVAHTELESSQPSDGDVVSQPTSQISLTFTRQVEPVAHGMTAFDESGLEHRPYSVDSADGLTWLIHFETPLPNGRVEFYWRVAAADGHILEGAFAFTVSVAEPQPSIAPSAGPDDAQHAADADDAVSRAGPAEPIETSIPQVTQPPSSSSTPKADSGVDAAPSDTPAPSPTASSTEPAHEDRSASTSVYFAQRRNSSTTGSQRIAETTRVLIVLATLGIMGGLAFMALIVRDEPLDSHRARRWVRASGIVLAVSAVVASLNRAVVIERDWSAFWSPDAIGDAVSTHFGVASGLRLLGGFILAVALRRTAASSLGRPRGVTAFLGGTLVIASFAFDGHTVTEGPRWLHAAASVIHVSAASVWSGGVVLLADLLWRRHRRGADVIRPLMRFSRMAATSLVLAGAVGTIMAVLVLNRFADLWSTSWGRLLLAKIALVAVAAAIGGHNRWVLIPAVEGSGQTTVHRRLQRAAVLEAIALLGVAVITAFLVAASAI